MTSALPEEPDEGTAILARLLRAERPGASLVDHMVEDIAQQIILGRLLPGADLNSVDLARHYGSSRTPVREALLTLQREGLVEIHAHRRARVAPMTLDQVRDVYQVRASLRGLVSELITRGVPDEGLAELERAVARLRADAGRGDVDAYFWGRACLKARCPAARRALRQALVLARGQVWDAGVVTRRVGRAVPGR